MISCGLSHNVLKWFKSDSCVKYNNIVSDMLTGKTYNLKRRDVISNLANLRINMYADDCLIYCTGNNWDFVRPKIE